jgi:hypothetical protein
LINQELLKAARDGDVMMVRVAVHRGAYLETRRPIAIGLSDHQNDDVPVRKKKIPGMTPLMHASKGSHLKCVTALLQAKANVNAEDEDGMRPLHFAALSGDYDIGAALLAAGADSQGVDDCGKDALNYLNEEVRKQDSELQRWQNLLQVPCKIGDQVESLTTIPEWKPRPVQIGDLGKILSVADAPDGYYEIQFEGVRGQLPRRLFKCLTNQANEFQAPPDDVDDPARRILEESGLPGLRR